MSDPHLSRWQNITLATLFTGYVGYYICRSNLSVATPLILDEFADQGITKVHMGRVTSIAILFYAVGKFTNGLLGDAWGGKAMFIFGLLASIACTVSFGVAGGITAFIVIWAANRYVQSMGWVALVKISSRWYPFHRHASIMGILSMSYLLGDAFARLYLGSFIGFGVGWRGIFFVSAATTGVLSFVIMLMLKPSPEAVGATEPHANPANVF